MTHPSIIHLMNVYTPSIDITFADHVSVDDAISDMARLEIVLPQELLRRYQHITRQPAPFPDPLEFYRGAELYERISTHNKNALGEYSAGRTDVKGILDKLNPKHVNAEYIAHNEDYVIMHITEIPTAVHKRVRRSR